MDPRSPADATGTTRAPTVVPERDDGFLHRSLPFVFAVALGLALLPVQHTPIDAPLLVASVALLGGFHALLVVLDRRPARIPPLLCDVMPYAFLVALAMLRSATGGSTSGYAALLYLVPFWIGLYDPRRAQAIGVTAAMFAALVLPGLAETDFDTLTPLRAPLLSTVVIGMISLAVQGKVSRLRAIETALRHETAARAAAIDDLAAANDALGRSNRDLEQFAYVSSHDLQEPLRMIRSFTQLFMQRHGDALDEEAHELLGFVTNGAERAQHLVSDLLDYSRVGTSTRAFEPVDLDVVVDRAERVLAPIIESAGATVVRERGMPTITGDPAQLERLFVNLLGNALRYRAPERPPEVRIEGRQSGQQWEVSISDNGIGFDDEHATRIFKMFQRLHGRDEYAGTDAGTGIGLSICERIVERHGGRIRATGTPGVGATFTFTLETAP